MSVPAIQKLYDRLVAKTVIDEGGCWLWQGSLHTSTKYPAGHHGLTMLNNKSISTHRAMWIAVHGSIPAGLHVCHRCDVPRCINPEHLWLGTHQDNMADMNRKGRNPMVGMTHCRRGHPFDEQNTYYRLDGRGRVCRICNNASTRKSEERRRSA